MENIEIVENLQEMRDFVHETVTKYLTLPVLGSEIAAVKLYPHESGDWVFLPDLLERMDTYISGMGAE